ncbi:hypothetical protein JKP88DRAFT_349604 [Tribonema minus]|uniref:Smr domain-containing protein n=1 Tax=Tribonema minus TaxID=303371 RepID=A0A835YUD4_9STRA|nr:hypothetical protein JKP88DRAFT_349604 [Tribonema minus]
MGWEISDDERDRQRTFHIGALARANRATDAWHTCHEYMQAGFRPGARTVQQVVCALARKRHDRMVLRFLKTLRGTGFKLDVKGYNIVLKACSMADSLEIAVELYHQMVHVDGTEPNVRTYDSLLSDMQAAGAVPPLRAYGPVLMACIMTRNDPRFRELTRELSHAEWASATELSNFYSRIVEGFVATGQLHAAVRILDGVAAAGRLSSRIVLPVLVHYARVLRDVPAVRGIVDAMRVRGARLLLAAWDMAIDTAWRAGDKRTATLNPYRLARPGVEPGRPMWTTETPAVAAAAAAAAPGPEERAGAPRVTIMDFHYHSAGTAAVAVTLQLRNMRAQRQQGGAAAAAGHVLYLITGLGHLRGKHKGKVRAAVTAQLERAELKYSAVPGNAGVLKVVY